MIRAIAIALSLFATSAFSSTLSPGRCFPKNNLNLEDRLDRKDANLDEAKFNEIIDQVESYYKPIVKEHGGELSIVRKWTDSDVDAYANQDRTTWNVVMFGGLARRPEITEDGFALVVCHEVGHHLGGFPYYGENWAASEGQADYFATQSCAKNIWKNEIEKNKRYRKIVPASVKEKCNNSFSSENEQNLCYRSADAGRSLATLLAALSKEAIPHYETPDTRTVQKTYTRHPDGQCRLDTYFSGALCTQKFDDSIIPGRNNESGQTSTSAEREAALHSCTVAQFYSYGKRPRCWYAPQMTLKMDKNKITREEENGNGNDIIEPGETFKVNVPLHNSLLAPIKNAELIVQEQTAQGKTYTSKYPTINPGESELASKPISIKIPDSAQCGKDFKLSTTIKVNKWSDKGDLKFFLGAFNTIDKNSETTNLEIPDNSPSGMTRSLIATSNKTATLINLNLDISHAYIGDLIVYLTSPSGKKYMISSREGSGGSKIKGKFPINITPEKPKGEWKLFVSDNYKGDFGHLNSWGLEFIEFVCQGK